MTNKEIDQEINKIIGNLSTNSDKDTLILSGGGVSGILYAGVFKALDELDILKNIKTIIGVSAGTLYSFMYLMGYNTNEIVKFAETFNGSKITSVKNFDTISFDKVLIEYGLDNGESFKKVFNKIAKQKNINPEITLLEFYNINKIKFVIGATNIDKFEEVYFSYESTPNVKLFDALRASISIPIYFTPVKINNELYVDGGCMNNFPINYCENNIDKTIAVIIINPVGKLKNNNFINYFINILKSMSYGWQKALMRGYSGKYIEIKSGVNNIFNFALEYEEKKRLIKLGYDSIMSSELNQSSSLES